MSMWRPEGGWARASTRLVAVAGGVAVLGYGLQVAGDSDAAPAEAERVTAVQEPERRLDRLCRMATKAQWDIDHGHDTSASTASAVAGSERSVKGADEDRPKGSARGDGAVGTSSVRPPIGGRADGAALGPDESEAAGGDDGSRETPTGTDGDVAGDGDPDTRGGRPGDGPDGARDRAGRDEDGGDDGDDAVRDRADDRDDGVHPAEREIEHEEADAEDAEDADDAEVAEASADIEEAAQRTRREVDDDEGRVERGED
jgi:hypothetical protein